MSQRSFDSNSYLARVVAQTRRFPLLTAEQELDLARRWRDHQDHKALDRLISAHLRLVVKIARGHSGYGLPLEDLVSQGHLGLMHAVAKFDPDRGARFATYATWWIRASIREYILRSWSLVKMGTTASQKKLFFNLARLKRQLRSPGETGLSGDLIERIAGTLDVPEADVQEMQGRLGGRDRSLNATVGAESLDEWQDLLAEESPDQEETLVERDELDWRHGLLQKGLLKLDARERRILEERKLSEDPLTLNDLSQEYGISRERVRQIEKRALEKLRKAVMDEARRESPLPTLPAPRAGAGHCRPAA